MSDKEYLLENPTTSTDVWGRLERAEQRIKELEEEVERLKRQLQGAWRFQDALSSLD